MACGNNGGCSTGCSRLAVTDWLENMLPPGTPEAENVYEVQFKHTHKAFFKNVDALDIVTGDLVVVESDRGWNVGRITMGGQLVQLQMRKKKFPERLVRKIYRKASEEDVAKLEESRSREYPTLLRARSLVEEHQLNMKLTDVELQADGNKGIFYYTANKRVDFRQLIKALAGEFKLRVEMKQIGLRQEAGLVGGIGSCGRELCCSSWLTNFNSVNTSAARYQNISLNPSKITGLCGRLKCCLNYELDVYLDALDDIPRVREIHTELGTARLQKTDIFKRIMWFSMGGDSAWTALHADDVAKLVKLNKAGKKPASLAAIEEEYGLQEHKEPSADFVDVVGQSDLHERLRQKPKKKGRVVKARQDDTTDKPRKKRGGKQRGGRNPKQED